MNRRLGTLSLLLGLAAITLLAGCKKQSFEKHQLRPHEAIHQRVCADEGGSVQVNIDGCTVPGFSFYGEFVPDGGGFYEYQPLWDGEQKRFDHKLQKGQCGTVSVINMDDGQAVTCNFHVYWDL